jgi:hypothetical protein
MAAKVKQADFGSAWIRLIDEFWKNDQQVFFGISIHCTRGSRYLIRLYYHKPVEYNKAKTTAKGLWGVFTGELAMHLKIVCRRPAAPLSTPPQLYRQPMELAIRHDGAEDWTIINPHVFRELDLKFTFRQGSRSTIRLTDEIQPYCINHYYYTFIAHDLGKCNTLESWRAPVYHQLQWMISTYSEFKCYSIEFVTVDNHSVLIQIWCAVYNSYQFLQSFREHYEIEHIIPSWRHCHSSTLLLSRWAQAFRLSLEW